MGCKHSHELIYTEQKHREDVRTYKRDFDMLGLKQKDIGGLYTAYSALDCDP